MANVALSPTMSSKLKTKESTNKIRHGSPKLQQVLRERCRQRMREKRGQLFNRGRFGLETNLKEVQETLTEIVRKEFINLATSESLPDIIDEPLEAEEALKIEDQIINEEEQWILEEYEKMSKEEMDLLAMTADENLDEVFCPLCQKSHLTQNLNLIVCKECNFAIRACITVKKLGRLITECVDNHSMNCAQTPGFTLIPENNNICLYIACHNCSTLLPVI